MSMSRKIFGIIALLIVVAAVITTVGVIGIGRINSSAEQLGRLAARSVNLTMMDVIVQKRAAATLRIIVNSDPAMIERQKNEQFLPAEKAMEAELASYLGNFPENPTPEMKQWPVEIKKRWDAYVAATAKVAELAQINSNTQANSLVYAQEEFWGAMDRQVADLLAAARETEGWTRSWGSRLADARADLAYYRAAISQTIASEHSENIKKYSDEARRRMESFSAVIKAGEELPGAFGSRARELSALLTKEGLPGMNEVLRLAEMNSNDKALAAYRNEADPAFAALDSYTTELEKVSVSGQGEALSAARALGAAVNKISIAVSAVGILLTTIIAFFIVSRIVRHLNQIISGLDDASAQVASAAGSVSESSVALAEGATEQAAALEESSAALEEVASMTRQNSESARETAGTTDKTVKLIDEGAEDVRNMSHAMNEISDSAHKIGQIIKTIEDIAFQTNLLALNAAVEAARAGEAGSGFAVVADEVRNLAQRSAQAARDTSDLINSTITRVQNGSRIAEKLDASFLEINNEAHGVGALVDGISIATGEQAQGIEQVNKAVTEMDKVTQSNAASAEECASASEELSAQAELLKGMVNDLLALVAGGKAGTLQTAVPSIVPAGVKRAASGNGANGSNGVAQRRQLPLPRHDEDDFANWGGPANIARAA